MKKALIFFSLILLISIFLLILYFSQNPLKTIDHLIKPLRIVSYSYQIVTHHHENRQYMNITFRRGQQDTLRVTISRPINPVSSRLPVIILLGGLEIGRESLKYIHQHGQNIIVAYEYPYRPKYWYEGNAIEQLPLIRRSVLIVPGQVTQLVHWLRQQGWSDTTRISLLGYSFGALAVPSILRIMQKHKIRIQGIVMAYGGVYLYNLLKTNLKTLPSVLRPLVARLASMAIRPVEPALHLPFLKGRFLLINGKYDQQIPETCWRKLHQLTPKPKTIVLLEAGHLHPRKKDLIHQVIQSSYEWLRKEELINPLE